jgi:hypothetical protein
VAFAYDRGGNVARTSKIAMCPSSSAVIVAPIRFQIDPTTCAQSQVRYDFGRAIGTKGETTLRVVVSYDGRVITAFPVA